jgi:hypothetical protein
VPGRHDAVIGASRKVDHGDGEQIAGSRAAHRDGASDDVRADVSRRHQSRRGDVDRVGQHIASGNPEACEELSRIPALIGQDAFVADGLDGDGVAGVHRRDGVVVLAGEFAPQYGSRRRRQVL